MKELVCPSCKGEVILQFLGGKEDLFNRKVLCRFDFVCKKCGVKSMVTSGETVAECMGTAIESWKGGYYGKTL